MFEGLNGRVQLDDVALNLNDGGVEEVVDDGLLLDKLLNSAVQNVVDNGLLINEIEQGDVERRKRRLGFVDELTEGALGLAGNHIVVKGTGAMDTELVVDLQITGGTRHIDTVVGLGDVLVGHDGVVDVGGGVEHQVETGFNAKWDQAWIKGLLTPGIVIVFGATSAKQTTLGGVPQTLVSRRQDVTFGLASIDINPRVGNGTIPQVNLGEACVHVLVDTERTVLVLWVLLVNDFETSEQDFAMATSLVTTLVVDGDLWVVDANEEKTLIVDGNTGASGDFDAGDGGKRPTRHVIDLVAKID